MSAVEYIAKHRFARITARKAGRIADLIRGRDVNEAIELLQFTPNRGATFYMKVVKSAVANASLDENVNVNRLFVCEARADIGPLLNNRLRFRPGPQGRAMPFAKRLSHLTIMVKERAEDGDDEAPQKKSKSKKAAGSKKSASRKSSSSKKAASAEAAPVAAKSAAADKTKKPKSEGKKK
ncbi:MAG: 50S ribosomal protein L22 [Planctomycetota bacterium]|nr:50S ribosomal protein L22 [Planctomycetota bacterium]